jgi:peptidoglycan-associated lipoprotein
MSADAGASAKSSAASAPVASTQALTPAQLEAQRRAALDAQQLSHRDALNGMSVLFGFDDATVKPDYTDLLTKQAQFLKERAIDRLILQGNTDERGGTEYNLALGQKRADAVRRALVLLGAPEDRIETTSFGEEKPKAKCHEESCWSQNRRVDFVHTDKH